MARTLLAAGRHEDAAAAAHKLFAVASATGQPLHAARLLLLLARVQREAGAPLAALPYALTCAAHARTLAADLLAAEAAVVVAQVWADMGAAACAARARRELEAVLPTVMAHGGLELQVRRWACGGGETCDSLTGLCWVSNGWAHVWFDCDCAPCPGLLAQHAS